MRNSYLCYDKIEIMDKRLEAFGRLLDVLDELRVKCPWDREQTFTSLRSSTIEETYELVDALMDENLDGIKKELGDLLLHVIFYAKIASEKNAFDIADVANAECDKLIFRHPHVFGSVEADTADQVKQNWEDLKLKEKEKAHEKKRVLSGVPRSLPSIVKAYRISQKVSSAGFDWEKKEDVWDKVQEEIGELQTEMQTADPVRCEEELGDLLFSLVNVARLYGINPDAALEKTNRKFIRRFTAVEERAEAAGKTLRQMTLPEMEALWQEAKKSERE